MPPLPSTARAGRRLAARDRAARARARPGPAPAQRGGGGAAPPGRLAGGAGWRADRPHPARAARRHRRLGVRGQPAQARARRRLRRMDARRSAWAPRGRWSRSGPGTEVARPLRGPRASEGRMGRRRPAARPGRPCSGGRGSVVARSALRGPRVAPLEALSAGALLVTTPSPGPVPGAARWLVSWTASWSLRDHSPSALAQALAAALARTDADRRAYAQRADALLAPHRAEAIRKTVAERVLPAARRRVATSS